MWDFLKTNESDYSLSLSKTLYKGSSKGEYPNSIPSPTDSFLHMHQTYGQTLLNCTWLGPSTTVFSSADLDWCPSRHIFNKFFRDGCCSPGTTLENHWPTEASTFLSSATLLSLTFSQRIHQATKLLLASINSLDCCLL